MHNMWQIISARAPKVIGARCNKRAFARPIRSIGNEILIDKRASKKVTPKETEPAIQLHPQLLVAQLRYEKYNVILATDRLTFFTKKKSAKSAKSIKSALDVAFFFFFLFFPLFFLFFLQLKKSSLFMKNSRSRCSICWGDFLFFNQDFPYVLEA
jgi:hypothetical protein